MITEKTGTDTVLTTVMTHDRVESPRGKRYTMKLKTLVLSESEADEFVDQTHRGFIARWNGWNIETFVPNPSAEYIARGSFNRDTGQWGYTYTFRPNKYGKWIVKVPA